MNILEFIRRNSLLVIIVIGVVGLGLVMMDYSGKGNMIAGDFYIQAHGSNYSYEDTVALGKNAEDYLKSLHSAASSKLRTQFDANGDDTLNDDELAALNAYLAQHPEVQQSLNDIENLYSAWAYGFSDESWVNIAVNRLILQQTAKDLGIQPSKEQVDAYLKSLPAFTDSKGNFDRELYRHLTGYRDGLRNESMERNFRSMAADIITWNCLRRILTEGLAYNHQAEGTLVDSQWQQISGKTATLAEAALKPAAEPTEEELKAYWENNKERYKSEERRVISVYTLTSAEGVSLQDMIFTSENIMETLAQANGRGVEQILEAATTNEDYAAFTYKSADGSPCVTYPACTRAEVAEPLKKELSYKGQSSTLGEIAFSEIEEAPTLETYTEDVKRGTPDAHTSFQQMRGFFPTQDGKLHLVQIKAIDAPKTLPYEEAKEAALRDLRQERRDNALAECAENLYQEMEKAINDGGALEAAFAKAAEAGANVQDFGPVSLSFEAANPTGVNVAALVSVAKGKLAPLEIENGKATISGVTKRTIEDSADYTAVKAFRLLPMRDATLRSQVLRDWLHDAYTRYNVQFSKDVKLHSK